MGYSPIEFEGVNVRVEKKKNYLGGLYVNSDFDRSTPSIMVCLFLEAAPSVRKVIVEGFSPFTDESGEDFEYSGSSRKEVKGKVKRAVQSYGKSHDAKSIRFFLDATEIREEMGI